MTVQRTFNVLMLAGAILMFGGLILAIAGAGPSATLRRPLFDIGMWVLTASLPLYLASYLAYAWFAVAGWVRS
jgi:phosphotransferase system  glucose/maltose/N-acetylglucosamine-specific IIC component